MVEAKIDPDKKVIFFLFFLLIAVIIGYTYTYFKSKGKSNEQTIKIANLDIKYIEDKDGIIKANNIVPILDKSIQDSATKLSFTIENIGNVNAKYSINFSNMAIDEELINSEFKWAIYSGEELIKQSNFSDAENSEDYVLIDNQFLEDGNNISYTLYIWISETNQPQDEMKGKDFSAKILIEALKA